MIKRKYMITVLMAIAVALMLVPSTQASIPEPDYDSGWVSIGYEETIVLYHNLGTEEVFVYLVGNDTHVTYDIIYGINQNFQNLRWMNLTATQISVFSQYNEYIRVMIWKIEAGVGGLSIPVDKFSLLAPYIALTLAIVLAISASIVYIKHRKKQ